MIGRVALITGASRGIGRAVAELFVTLGAHVIAPTREELDLGVPASVDRYLARLDGPVDILINDAGVNRLAGIGEVDDASLYDTLEVDLIAPLRLARALTPGMATRGWGRVVNISSVWTLVARERRLPYIVAKSGLNGLTRALAVELAGRGVLVNAVAPGFVMTEMTKQNNTGAQIRAIADALPIARLAAPEEIAELVAFLSSSRNSYMTGQIVVCDGGFTLV